MVITSLGGGHTDTQTQTHIHTLRGQDQYLETRRAPAFGRRAPGLKTNYTVYTYIVLMLHLCTIHTIESLEESSTVIYVLVATYVHSTYMYNIQIFIE